MLRPLGLGEILDRAVTLCVRHFVLFSLIFVVYAVPLAIVQYFGTADQTKLFGGLTDILRAQAAGKTVDPNSLAKALSQTPVLNGWTGLWFFLLLFVAPLPTAALIDATTTTYLGRTITFQNAYRTALTRWLPLIGIALLYLCSAMGLYMVLLIVVLIVGLTLGLLAKALGAVGVALLIAIAVAFLLALAAFVILATLAFNISYFSCIVENMPFISAFTRGISRVFSRGALGRSLLAGLAFYAISIGVFLVSIVGESVLFGLLKSNVAGLAYHTVVTIATVAFTTAFIAIFYFDLRVRSEGLDLQLAAGGEPLRAS